jgi:predicted ArsR family transcriptional regulator
MRPRGEIRQLLFEAVGLSPGTSRDLAARTQVGYEHARRTLDNLCRAEDIVVVGEARVEGVRRPVPVYGRPAPGERSSEASSELAHAMAGCWVDFA